MVTLKSADWQTAVVWECELSSEDKLWVVLSLDEVRDLVVRFLDDVAAGRDPSPRLGDTDPLILRRVIWALEAHATDLARRDAWEVVVRSGDVGEFGDGSATHHAVIRTGGVDRFGLRLVGPDDGQELLIVGYWVPEENR